jgi:hypothetical protein
MRLGDPARAADAFRSVRDNRGRFTWAFPLYPLSHLWLARAVARAGDQALARQEYDAFLSLWKKADLDLRPLVDARGELPRLTRGDRRDAEVARSGIRALWQPHGGSRRRCIRSGEAQP